ncbi:MAG: tetratricopeptide repeat protein [Cyclobacteriaceae bacterium]|nr:tetratricopeptide repeat protein [Cyclobacteriaceae bacterium]
MKKITLLLIYFLVCVAFVQAQNPPAKKKQQPKEEQSMEEMMKDLKKQMESMSPEDKKIMEEMGLLDVLKDVEKMTKGVDMKQVMAAAEAEAQAKLIPKTPSTLPINPTPVNKEQLKSYLQPMLQSTEAAMKPESKAEAKKYLNKGAETSQAAMGFVLKNEWDKSLYLLLNAGIANPEDYASLNNLGAMITMAGYAHKSLPILQYVQKQFPQSPTLLGNMGQAWLSLGHIDKAEKFLKDALDKDEENTGAALSLAVMYKQQGNTKQCASYAQKAAEGGCISIDAIEILKESGVAADVIAEHIRKKFKPLYKDHAITKRFMPPAVPSGYSESAMIEIKQFFADLDVTINETYGITDALMKEYEAAMQDRMQNGMKEVKGLKTAKERADYVYKYYHPFMYGASTLQTIMGDPALSTSFTARIEREKRYRQEQETALRKSLRHYGEQGRAIRKQMDGIEGGEGDIEGEERLEQLSLQLCNLDNNYTREYSSGISAINNEYIRKMEDLLNQQLQENIFCTIVTHPYNSNGLVYRLYLSYLKEIHSFNSLYTDIHKILECRPSGLPEKEPSITGKLKQWEADHCNLDWGVDLMVTGFKMNCQGFETYARIGAVKVGYGETIDPVTWNPTGYTAKVEVGTKKEFGVGQTLKGEIGASVGGSITFDAGGNIVNAGVNGSVGAGVSGPMGGSAGGSLGSGEYTLRGGFNGAGPSVNSPGSSFLRN